MQPLYDIYHIIMICVPKTNHIRHENLIILRAKFLRILTSNNSIIWFDLNTPLFYDAIRYIIFFMQLWTIFSLIMIVIKKWFDNITWIIHFSKFRLWTCHLCLNFRREELWLYLKICLSPFFVCVNVFF